MRGWLLAPVFFFILVGCQSYQTVDDVENKGELNRYLQHLSKKIEIIGAARYPDLHELVKTSTQVEIEMLISKTGKLLSAVLVRGSNDVILDEALMDIIRYAAPHPPLPDELNINVLKVNKIWILSPMQ